jgi:hypothetical protein
MNPWDQAQQDQEDMAARIPIVKVGQAEPCAENQYHVRGWVLESSYSHPRSEKFRKEGLAEGNSLKEVDKQSAESEVWGSGWTGLDLIQIARMESLYQDPAYDREAGE